ncbi:hypothetical protein [Sphingomonas fennica]|uniref:Uncharacterized protein n=1 Tax=Edaphosphingomonas fennica TaxID=114404 RepID=A0A2T4HXC1_9SPHN|nr:hypothetical protein [Sphingomonas fennica]PTD20431.1 hypothetical protein CV103_11375 [Sphingomonas fennica]
MSRSRRKIPIAGVTTAASDKPFKQSEHGRERTAAKIALAKGDEPASRKAFGDPWRGEKDGKAFRPDDPSVYRK